MIMFSPHGEYLVVFRREVCQLDIYYLESPDAIYSVFEQIKNNEQPLVTFTQKRQLSRVSNMKFDPYGRYLALYGKDCLSVIKLETHDKIPMIELDNFDLNKKYK